MQAEIAEAFGAFPFLLFAVGHRATVALTFAIFGESPSFERKVACASQPFSIRKTEVSKPGRASFVPDGGGPDSFSFQWIEKNQVAAVHVNQLQLQWRSPSGNQVTMLRGDLAVSYATDGCIGSA